MIEIGFLNRRSIRFVAAVHPNATAASSLAMIAEYLDAELSRVELSRLASNLEREPDIGAILDVANRLGLSAKIIELESQDVPKLSRPAFLQFANGQFAVVEQVTARRASLHDPQSGTDRITRNALLARNPVRMILFEKIEPFTSAPKPQTLRLSAIWRQAKGLPVVMAQVLALSMVAQAFALSIPYYAQIAIDRAIPALDSSLLVVLAVGFGLFCIFNVLSTFLRSFVLLYAGTKLSMAITSNVVRHLLRLPLAWFSQRHVGDILSRFQSIVPLQKLLTEGAVATLIDGALVITTFAVMLYYSVTLASISAIAFILYCVVRFISFQIQRRFQEAVIVASGREQSTLIESIRGVSTLRMLDGEEMRHRFWETRLAASAEAGIALARTSIWQTSANAVIFGLESILIIYLAISYVIDGAGFSVGMVFAFISYRSQFTARGTSLIDQIVVFKMLGLHLERLSEIVLTETDRGFEYIALPEQSLTGRLDLTGISFRFGPELPLVLDQLSLRIEAGECVAIRGVSGEGKTTLMKIICGLLEPAEGQVLVDDIDVHRYGLRAYRRQIGAVHQDDALFAGTLADNIAFFDAALDMERVIESARMSAIHEDIIRMPLRYETLVGDMGSSLSGGQRQRVLIARSLYRRPRILVLDEGTSHLDPACEMRVSEALRDLKITRLIVAHRPQTLQMADRVLELRGGRLHAT